MEEKYIEDKKNFVKDTAWYLRAFNNLYNVALIRNIKELETARFDKEYSNIPFYDNIRRRAKDTIERIMTLIDEAISPYNRNKINKEEFVSKIKNRLNFVNEINAYFIKNSHDRTYIPIPLGFTNDRMDEDSKPTRFPDFNLNAAKPAPPPVAAKPMAAKPVAAKPDTANMSDFEFNKFMLDRKMNRLMPSKLEDVAKRLVGIKSRKIDASPPPHVFADKFNKSYDKYEINLIIKGIDNQLKTINEGDVQNNINFIKRQLKKMNDEYILRDEQKKYYDDITNFINKI
jgi:hypothetical protein